MCEIYVQHLRSDCYSSHRNERFSIAYIDQGECIGQGTYQELSKSGIDLMALLVEEEEDDSAVESDSELNMKRYLKRSISRQHSQHEGRRERTESLHSFPSHRTSLVWESQLSVLTSETDTSIFVSSTFF